MSTGRLENKVAIVTGAGRGIGRAIALGYAREGASIAAVARSEDELKSVVGEISQMGRKAVSIPADLADRKEPARVVEQVEREFGTIDILVNNAGVGSVAGLKPVVDFDNDIWDYTLALNLTSPYYFCKAVIPIFTRKKKGRIINIASLASKIGLVHGVAYTASKHGLLGLTKTLALELGADGITVNAICPGPVRSRMNEVRTRYDADRHGVAFEEWEKRMNVIGRRLVPEEIAPMAILLASDEAAGITGQGYNIDGGAVMY
jgi:NAD(P)-dependent dehydrogenase (short-subunit alcohol dehydrogenase family)